MKFSMVSRRQHLELRERRGVILANEQAELEYRREIAETPNYPDGAIRPEWHELPEIARWQRVRHTRPSSEVPMV